MSDATTPAVAPDGQRYGHDEAMLDLAHMDDVASGTRAFRRVRLAAYIERLEDERDALLAEHEAARRLEHWHPEGCRFCAAHDNAERVIRGE
jgi:hypothetical protein